VGIMRDRTTDMRKLGIREWRITPEHPARVILIDEAGQLFRKNVGRKITSRVIGAVDTLTYQSRKCGYVVVACTQHSNLDQIPIRHGLTFGVAHRMKTRLGYEQVTGNGLDMPPLPRGVQGLAYMSGQGKRILRTQWIPKLERYREPVILNSARIPAFNPNEVERVPVYADHIGTVDTMTGEVLDSDDLYAQFQPWSEDR
jgi:hypothetical protein